MTTNSNMKRTPRNALHLGGRIPVAMVAACPFPANRGTPFRILQMGEALDHLGYDVHVVSYHLGSDRPTPNMQVHRIPKVRFYDDFEAGPNYTKLTILDPLLFHTLLNVVRKYRIRILHAHHFEGALCALAVKKVVGGVHVVYDAHTSLHDELMDYATFRIPKVVKRVASNLLDGAIPRWADHTIAVSERLRRFVVSRGIPEEKVSVVPMGVNSDEFLFEPTADSKKALGLPLDRPLIVYTGSLAAFQGIDHLLDSWPHVLKQRPNALAVIVGGPVPAWKETVARRGLSDSVRFEGERPFPEVKRYLSAADVVVLPRDNCVGFPLKLLNYMAAGKAIVAFKGGSGEVLTHLANGYVVEDGKTQAFADGIIHCLSTPGESQRLGSAAKVTATSYDVRAMEARVGALYGRLLAEDGLAWKPGAFMGTGT